jgi:hypothetical protein
VLAWLPAASAGAAPLLCRAHLRAFEETLPPLVVGCELVDCCPGCPARETLGWVVRLVPEGASAVFRFENLPADVASSLVLEGSARWRGEGALEVRAPGGAVRGFPRELPGPPATASVEMELGPAVRGTDGGSEPPPTLFRLVVEQRLGQVAVAEYGIAFDLGPCPGPPGLPQDAVVLADDAGGDGAALLLDLCRAPGCQLGNDEIGRGAGEVGVGDARQDSAGLGEVVVFSRGDAVRIVEGSAGFTDALGDRVRVSLTPDLLPVPVKVWVLVNGGAVRATDDLSRARFILDGMGCGLELDAATRDRSVLSGDPVARSDCDNAAELHTKVGFAREQLNVYYVDLGTRGLWCGGNSGGGTILIGTTADGETLAHELGHAFTLAHVQNRDYDGDGQDDFDASNVMWGGGIGRSRLSEGQCFRCNVHPDSAVQLLGVRGAPTHRCDADTITGKCPWIGLDVLPD